MPKPRLITHIGTAQVFKGRVDIPKKKEEEKKIPTPEPTPEPVSDTEN